MANQEKSKPQRAISETQIAAWKKKYGEKSVFEVEVPLDDGPKGKVAVGYIRKPTLDIMGAAAKFQNDGMKMANILFENCYLGGDPEITENEEAKISVLHTLKDIFKIRAARIKNL